MKTTAATLIRATATASASKSKSKAHLRSLINLHHASAAFMRDPSEVAVAFEAAFRHHKPDYQTYMSYRDSALESITARAPAGLETLAERSAGGIGAKTRQQGESPDLDRAVFRPFPRWSAKKETPAAALTERELQVKEAMFGTWERGLDGRPRPGLEGVVEILEARGVDGHVNKVKLVEDETEDGM